LLVHELSNLLNTVLVLTEVITTGNVGIAGSTGAILKRNLTGARDLALRSLDGIRVKHRVPIQEQILLASFIEEIAAATTLEANIRGVVLVVAPVENTVTIEGDRSVLSGVLANILQNAMKFTHPNSTVCLSVRSSDERVLIEVEDECGGLPDGDANDLFRPFVQRSTDRTGVGLGLAFSRWGVEASGGKIYARNLPGKGCVFTVDLPRVGAPIGSSSEALAGALRS